jgi:hypothetical protein
VAAVTIGDGEATPFAPYAYSLSSLVAAGRFVLIGGREGGGVFDGETGKLASRRTPLDLASAIAVRGTTAYVGGDFRTTVGGDNLLAIDLRSGKLRNWFPPSRRRGLGGRACALAREALRRRSVLLVARLAG